MIVVDDYNTIENNTIRNQIKTTNKKNDSVAYRRKDKADRATVELCLDPKTLYRLEKLINKGDLEYYEGCISTGKEANVYYGKGFEKRHLAIKIYKTSILVFKDRERYISGEFRFRHGYCKSNPRKMVAIWAEKEVRNLKRIQLSGLKTPTPLLLKSNLIIMELIGKDGQPAPRLKDAEELIDDYDEVYHQVIFIMRVMFLKCKIVHADLSEYNLLYHDKEVWVIDVAQAVEDDHPNALSFLKRDCTNINNFFKKYGVDTLTNKQLFNIVSVFSMNKNVCHEEIKEMVYKARKINQQMLLKKKDFFDLENHAFEHFDFPRTLEALDEYKIDNNSDIRKALISLCGIVQEKSSYLVKKDDNLVNDDLKDEDYLIVGDEKYISLLEELDKLKKQQKEEQKEIEKAEEDKIEQQQKEEDALNKINEDADEDQDDDSDNDDDESSEASEEDVHCIPLTKDNKNKEDDKDLLYFDEDGKIIDKETSLKLQQEKKEREKKGHGYDPFEGLSKQERKKKVKEENKEKRQNKKLTKYQKQKKIEKTSGKKK